MHTDRIGISVLLFKLVSTTSPFYAGRYTWSEVPINLTTYVCKPVSIM